MTEATDADRFPTLTDSGRATLARMVEHPAAPRFRHRSGNRLTTDDVAAVARYGIETFDAHVPDPTRDIPGWVAQFLGHVFATTPHFRALGLPPERLADLPTTCRADLAADIAAFVPDDAPVARLIAYRTTGTTGHPLNVPSHPQVAARTLVFHKRALARFGIVPRHGAGEIGVVLLGHQRRCFTYVSVTPTMGESGLAKINLHPDEWRDPADRARYLKALAPEFVAGDPLSFAALLEIAPDIHPRALLSVSMMLLPGLRLELEARFDCPVLDLYSMNEVGPIASWDEAAGGHVLLQPRLHLEIVDEHGRAQPPGVRGEICVTGGFNFCLPLVRYRTGDFAALARMRGEPILLDLTGRKPVRFRAAGGDWINNIDVSHALAALPLAHYALHQARDGSLRLRVARQSLAWAQPARDALLRLFGDAFLMVEPLKAEDKVLQYSTDLPEA